jgi:predicted SAM-dependent methyltransferase
VKIDLILPPGRHSWNLDEGWGATLQRLGLLRAVTTATAAQAESVLREAEHSPADLIILMGGDHHMPFLHDTERKRERWAELRQPTVCFCYESIRETRFPGSKEKSESAARAFSHFTYCDELDADFFAQLQVPAIWLPQCVDHANFHPPAAGQRRSTQVYFRGKLDSHFGYDNRRAIVDRLKAEGLLSAPESEITPQAMMEDYRAHQIAINLPGNFGGYNVRTFEALASGCALLQFQPPGRPRNNALFEDGRELIGFDAGDPERLVRIVRELQQQPERLQALADAGRAACLARHTIEARVRQIIDFVTETQRSSSRLHIGCGTNLLKGFRNLDCRSLHPFVEVTDAARLENVPDNSAELFYACHVLEHFSRAKVPEVLQQWVRKLRPGGQAFVAVPDFAYLAWRYLYRRKLSLILPPLFGGQEYPENFHYTAFDRRELTKLMQAAGLTDIKPFKAKAVWFARFDCSQWKLSLNLTGRKP